MLYIAKQKHLGFKKVRGQSEAINKANHTCENML